MKVILASSSPRRHELLNQMGVDHTVEYYEFNEEVKEGLDPLAYVKTVSQRKIMSIVEKYFESGDMSDKVIITADTIVSVDNEFLGKPKTEEEAFDMLRALSGRAHTVCTGVSIAYFVNEDLDFDRIATETTVYFRDLTDDEIKDYIATDEAYDKAGGYGIQGKGAYLVDKIDGDFYSVVGFPVSKVYAALKARGVIGSSEE